MAGSFAFLLAIVLLLLVHSEMARAFTNLNTDKLALLSLKSQFHFDPASQILLRNWSASAPVCNWIGVSCSSRHERVVALDISTMGLTGTLVPQLGNLTFLVSLNLSDNNFNGAVPRELIQLRRLKVVDFFNNTLGGGVPPWFGSLSRLEVLDMSFNPLQGQIPQEIGNLRNLKVLRLRETQLTGTLVSFTRSNLSNIEWIDLSWNSFSGELPSNICHDLPTLEELYLSRNGLDGQIPPNISECAKLRILHLSDNKFGGQIPREMGRLRMLEQIYLRNNNLIGVIPEELGNLTILKELGMSQNQLSGIIPSQVFNISTLQHFILERNNLSGILAADMCYHLKQLKVIRLSENEISGPVPSRFYECSALRNLDLSFNKLIGSIPPLWNSTLLQTLALIGNKLTGEIPEEICTLNNLEELYLSENRFSGSIPIGLLNISTLRILTLSNNKFSGIIASNLGYKLPNLERFEVIENSLTSSSLELNFMASLTNCRHLKILGISENPFNGILPASIGNLSTSLKNLYAKNCNLGGTILGEIGNLSSLILLDLSGNRFVGLFPTTLGNMKSLQGLDLSGNKIYGAIPNTICQLDRLNQLWMSNNEISGAIPNCLDNITSLSTLKMDCNRLNFNVPTSLWNLVGLHKLNLSSNLLIGSLAPEMAFMKSVVEIDLSLNQFTGVIPIQIGGLQSLTILQLAHNELHGTIPESMANMLSLTILDLSHNELSGVIPKSLQKFVYLKSFNVSFNGFNGEIPSDGPFKNFTFESFMFNKGLCGHPRFHVLPCVSNEVEKPNRKLQVLLISLGTSSFGLVVIIACIRSARYQRKNRAQFSRVTHFWSTRKQSRVSNYYELLTATNGYNESNLLGSGSFGSVYKGTLANGNVVAVKVFNSQLEGAFRSFEVECEILRNLRHRNLCKVIDCCSNEEFKALVLEYMPRGSLDKWLYSHNFLNMFKRIDIMIDVACALEYLHQGCSMPVIHCDLKPSNILIDKNMTAHLCDFGVSKLLGVGESIMQTMTLGTLSYIAPEYGMGGFVSVKCDIYSYGIVLMEVFTRKKPNDDIFTENLSLRGLVKDSVPNAVIDIVDPSLLRPSGDGLSQMLDALSSVFELALNFSVESPRERTSINDIIKALKKIKLELHGI